MMSDKLLLILGLIIPVFGLVALYAILTAYYHLVWKDKPEEEEEDETISTK